MACGFSPARRTAPLTGGAERLPLCDRRALDHKTPMISFNSSRFIASWLLLAPLLAACGDNQQQAAPPPPAVTVAKPVKQHGDRSGRICRPLRGGGLRSKSARAWPARSTPCISRTGRSSPKAIFCSPSTAGPLRTRVAQARANLMLARSNLTFAESDLARAQQLVRDKAIAEQVYDQRAQTKRNAEASVAANRGGGDAKPSWISNSPKYARRSMAASATAAFRPETWWRRAADATLLATIVSTNPIRFEFTFDEASLLRYDRVARQNADQPVRGLSLPVKLRLIDETDFKHKGAMDFVDNAIERATGTIRGRAVFDNKDELFVPGMFGRVQIPAGPPGEALLVPDAAIGTDQARKFVFVVEPDDTAKQAYVTLGQAFGDKRVVREGLTPESRVVVNGLMRVRPGIKVTPQEEGAAPATRRHAHRSQVDTGQADAHFAFLHRPADLRRRHLDRDRDPRRRVFCPPAGRAISRHRAAHHQRDWAISRRQRRDRRLHGGVADRGSDQRRGRDALCVVQFHFGRPLLHRRDFRSRHQPRYRPGAGAEPRRHRAAAAAGRRAQHRRYRQQGLARPDDGRASCTRRTNLATSSTSPISPAWRSRMR